MHVDISLINIHCLIVISYQFCLLQLALLKAFSDCAVFIPELCVYRKNQEWIVSFRYSGKDRLLFCLAKMLTRWVGLEPHISNGLNWEKEGHHFNIAYQLLMKCGELVP